VAQTQIRVRPWRPEDAELLAAADLSPTALTSRFMTGTANMPAAYLRYVTTSPRDGWDAQVATLRGRLLGWAEFGRSPGRSDEADLAVLVVDAWQRRGVATALFKAMLPRAAAAGVRVVHADVAPGNTAARAAVAKLFGPALRACFQDGLVHYRMALR
jgi:RimJ/RimL family protein N-acetyltransferase